LKDVFRGLLLVPLHDTKLRESKLVRMIFRIRELTAQNRGARRDLVEQRQEPTSGQ
jgi:hypothetical protein